MKMATGVMIAMVCINAGALWVQIMFDDTPFLTPIEPEEYFEQVNSTKLASSYAQSPADSIVDIAGPLTWLWDLNFPFIEGFWGLLQNAGMPINLVRMLKVPYRLLELFLLVELVRNTDLTGV